MGVGHACLRRTLWKPDLARAYHIYQAKLVSSCPFAKERLVLNYVYTKRCERVTAKAGPFRTVQTIPWLYPSVDNNYLYKQTEIRHASGQR